MSPKLNFIISLFVVRRLTTPMLYNHTDFSHLKTRLSFRKTFHDFVKFDKISATVPNFISIIPRIVFLNPPPKKKNKIK